MLPVIQILGFSVPTKPFALLAALYLGLWLTAKEVRRLGLDPKGEQAWNWGFASALGGLVGARLGYVVQFWPLYRQDLGQIFSLRPGTLALGPGVLAGLLVGLIYLRWRRIPLIAFADGLAPGLALALAVGNFANFLSGDGFGAPADLPWSVELWGAQRHPAQVYQLLANLGVLAMLWSRRRKAAPGTQTLTLLLLYSLSRLGLEMFRGDSVTWVGGIRAAQVIALTGALLAMGGFARLSSRERRGLPGDQDQEGD